MYQSLLVWILLCVMLSSIALALIKMTHHCGKNCGKAVNIERNIEGILGG